MSDLMCSKNAVLCPCSRQHLCYASSAKSLNSRAGAATPHPNSFFSGQQHLLAMNRNRVKGAIKAGRKLDELILPASRLRLCSEQLHNLNFMFDRKLESSREQSDGNIALARSVTERLVQRLICGAGLLDSRFCSKYLVALHDQNNFQQTSQTLQYLIRLDALSTPGLYEHDAAPKYNIMEGDAEYPPGYARLRLQAASFKVWGEFANSAGYLRRDKVQARLIELLAKAAGNDEPSSPLHVDESLLCGSPGKIIDASTLHHILHKSTEEQVFYGAGGGTPRFPDPRDFRLAIVDEPDGIRLRVEFLSPALANISMNVRLLVAVGVDSWPTSTDFPFRISLGHADCLLYYRAAQTGMFLVGYGVHSSAWQIRFPAAEYTLLNHYSSGSTVRTILEIMRLVLDEINEQYDRRRQQMSYKILNEYILRTALFYELENDDSNPTAITLNWSPLYLSTHVLRILDKLIASLQKQHQPSYFFSKSNLLANPGHLCEDDYVTEAHKLQRHLLKLFDESLMSTRENHEFHRLIVSLNTETMLLAKWKEIIDGLSPPPSTRGRRMCLAFYSNGRETAFAQYTHRQLEYIGFLLKNVLSVKENVWQNSEDCWASSLPDDSSNQHPIEDVIYILVTIMEQALEIYLKSFPNPKLKPKVKIQFNASTTKLVELVRKDRDITFTNVADDISLVKIMLKWLYKAMDQNKKHLAPVLRPYLSTIFSTSHAISWHIETIKKSTINDELDALGAFAKLVNDGKITPAHALVDAVNKKWSWAKNMLKNVEEGNLRLVFVPEREKVFRHILSLPAANRKKSVSGNTNGGEKKMSTFTNTCYFSTLSGRQRKQSNISTPQHCVLKLHSPMTYTLFKLHRRGNHRCCGDIFEALISMRKVNVVQEISNYLPSNERMEVLETIQQVLNERGRRTVTKRWSNTLPQQTRATRAPKYAFEQIEKYTPKEESAGIKVQRSHSTNSGDVTTRLNEVIKKLDHGDTLLGSCRAARIREDNSIAHFQENFRIKGLNLGYKEIKRK